MATIADVRSWYERDLSRYASWEQSVEIVPSRADVQTDGNYLTVRFYSDTNWFTITARDPKPQYRETEPPQMPDDRGFVDPRPTMPRPAIMDAGYLGCVASSRKPRAGETWRRGSDLADGPLTEETWHRILGDIVSYELVRVHRPQVPVLAQEFPTAEQCAAAQVARPWDDPM